MSATISTGPTEQWGVFELSLKGSAGGNPFTDVTLSAVFSLGTTEFTVNGFYDGNDTYKIRFMPDQRGDWSYKTESNVPELSSKEGTFTCTAPSPNNHGPVQVADTYFFQYADGSSYYPVGTTSYGWVHQQNDLAETTLKSLKKSPFNKLRMCILPHYSEFSRENIIAFPFEGDEKNGWDFNRLNPLYFRIVEQRILALMELGIEADIILLHPYNQEWGFGSMNSETDNRYILYLINRIGSFRNVWWSLANEYDMMGDKTLDDWERIGQLISRKDIYKKLCSIHNWRRLYEYWKPWITHASIQDGLAVADTGRAVILRKAYQKPVIYDEVCYEGNFTSRWGDLSAEEFTHRFWQGIAAGTYVGHGEVCRPPGKSEDHVWTGIGETLQGDAVERMRFAREVLEQIPGTGLEPVDVWFHENVCSINGEYFLIYFGKDRPAEWEFEFPINDVEIPEGTEFQVDIIDTWNMTVTDGGKYLSWKKSQYLYGDIYNRSIPLPEKPYIALRISRTKELR